MVGTGILPYTDRDNVSLNNTQAVYDHLYGLSNKNAMLLFMNDNFTQKTLKTLVENGINNMIGREVVKKSWVSYKGKAVFILLLVDGVIAKRERDDNPVEDNPRGIPDVAAPYTPGSDGEKSFLTISWEEESVENDSQVMPPIDISARLTRTKALMQLAVQCYALHVDTRNWCKDVITLIEYKEENGHDVMPYTNSDDLGNWVHNQRSRRMKQLGLAQYANMNNSAMTDHERCILDDIGFIWSVIKSVGDEGQVFKQFLAKVGNFVEMYGTGSVSTSYPHDQTFAQQAALVRTDYAKFVSGVGQQSGMVLDEARVALLTDAGFNFTPLLELKGAEKIQKMEELMKQFGNENGHYEVGYPSVALSPEYHPVYWWLVDVRSRCEDGSLTVESPEIKCLVALGMPLEKIRRGPRDASIEGRWYEDILERSVVAGIPVVWEREAEIDTVQHPKRSRRIDVAGVCTVLNNNAEEIVVGVGGENDERQHSGYPVEKEQCKQIEVNEYFKKKKKCNLTVLIRGNSGHRATIDECQQEKWISIMNEAIQRAETMSPSDYQFEIHMLDYVPHHHHVLANKERICPRGYEGERATREDQWNDFPYWDRMYLHSSGAATGL